MWRGFSLTKKFNILPIVTFPLYAWKVKYYGYIHLPGCNTL